MPDIKLGSLFDGIGVFPLAASRCGIRPVWASEIEKAPISITKRHFPDMAHLGDITKVDGGKIPPVHVITFGSPCQNLSLIGNRSGLAGAKSSLFYQAFRIIQEMRDAKTRPVFEQYKATKYSRKFLAEHEADLELYRAAQTEMRSLLGGAKLPKMDVLKEEGRKLTAKKKQLYGEYQKARRDMQELVTIKANIDTLMGYTEPGRKQEKER